MKKIFNPIKELEEKKRKQEEEFFKAISKIFDKKIKWIGLTFVDGGGFIVSYQNRIEETIFDEYIINLEELLKKLKFIIDTQMKGGK